MALFGVKKNIEDSSNKEKLEGKSLGKDSRPENQKPQTLRKKKIPKKPWGKKERFFVLFVILLTAGVSGFLALSSRSWKLPGLPR